MSSITVCVSIPKELYDRIEHAMNGKYDHKAILFKRSPFYAKVLEAGVESMEIKND